MKNVCIVGYGAIAPLHTEFLRRIPSANLYAVCDTDPRALARCNAENNVVCYHHFSEVLKDSNIDTLHICTPHFLHYPMVRDNENAPFKVLTPCGICQERLRFWGDSVQVGVTTNDSTPKFVTLKELQPYHWTDAYSTEDLERFVDEN